MKFLCKDTLYVAFTIRARLTYNVKRILMSHSELIWLSGSYEWINFHTHKVDLFKSNEPRLSRSWNMNKILQKFHKIFFYISGYYFISVFLFLDKLELWKLAISSRKIVISRNCWAALRRWIECRSSRITRFIIRECRFCKYKVNIESLI